MKGFEYYWNTIPVGEKNAISYEELIMIWRADRRTVRRILHDLSEYDNMDNYVLIRSGHGKGFYRTDDAATILAYKKECINKGRSNFAPVKKINRIMTESEGQGNIFNSLKDSRMAAGITQKEVADYMREFDQSFDCSALSKLENGVFLPTPYQLLKLAQFYGVNPSDLIKMDLQAADIFGAI